MEQTREGFQSKWGFILSCIGSAVGMGNIWRFPILVQKYGGMTFLLPYFIFVILVSATGVIEEFALGRRAGAGPVGAFGMCTKERTGKKSLGEALGAIPIVGALMLSIGYTVIMSWVFKYCWMGISGSLYGLGTDMSAISSVFGETAPEAGTLGEAVSMILQNGIFGIANGVWVVIAVVIVLGIMSLGVAGGIEKANKIMMPLLFGVFICLGVYIFTLDGASEGYKYIFTINPSGLVSPEVWVYAFGQAFFSLSVTGNGSIIYGSYLSKEEDVVGSARNVGFFDTLGAMLATFIILPAMAVVLGQGISEVTGGPGMMFIYLINVFNSMPGGRLVGMVFYICVLFAGISSCVCMYEAPVAFLQDKLKLKRGLSVAIIGAIGCVSALLIQPWVSPWMDIVSIYICPLGALIAGIMFFWVLKKKTADDAVNEGRTTPIGGWFYPLGKYVFCISAIVALVAGIIYGGIG